MISVICPVLNEEKYIREVLTFFTAAAPVDKELFIVDGGSTDKTLDIVNEFARRHANIILLHNPDRYVSFALNLAIPQCKGDIIVRLDAHSVYDNEYFVKILDTFSRVDADIVGGPMLTTGVTPFQKAVAYATSQSFGVGNSNFHFKEFEGYTDSVYLGAWKKSIFQTTGRFDVTLVRNQDDEFHYRAKSLGFKIYQNPAIKVTYFPRDSARALFKQYFQYGLYKPKVLKKIKTEIKVRHLIPFLFVCYLLTLPVTVFFPWWIIPLAAYFALAFVYSRHTSGSERRIDVVLVFFLLHVSYGSGFLLGLFKR